MVEKAKKIYTISMVKQIEEGKASWAGVTNVGLDRRSIWHPDATRFARYHLSEPLLSCEGGVSGYVCGLLHCTRLPIKIRFTGVSSSKSITQPHSPPTILCESCSQPFRSRMGRYNNLRYRCQREGKEEEETMTIPMFGCERMPTTYKPINAHWCILRMMYINGLK